MICSSVGLLAVVSFGVPLDWHWIARPPLISRGPEASCGFSSTDIACQHEGAAGGHTRCRSCVQRRPLQRLGIFNVRCNAARPTVSGRQGRSVILCRTGRSCHLATCTAGWLAQIPPRREELFHRQEDDGVGVKDLGISGENLRSRVSPATPRGRWGSVNDLDIRRRRFSVSDTHHPPAGEDRSIAKRTMGVGQRSTHQRKRFSVSGSHPARDGKCEGRRSHREINPELVPW